MRDVRFVATIFSLRERFGGLEVTKKQSRVIGALPMLRKLHRRLQANHFENSDEIDQ